MPHDHAPFNALSEILTATIHTVGKALTSLHLAAFSAILVALIGSVMMDPTTNSVASISSDNEKMALLAWIMKVLALEGVVMVMAFLIALKIFKHPGRGPMKVEQVILHDKTPVLKQIEKLIVDYERKRGQELNASSSRRPLISSEQQPPLNASGQQSPSDTHPSTTAPQLVSTALDPYNPVLIAKLRMIINNSTRPKTVISTYDVDALRKSNTNTKVKVNGKTHDMKPVLVMGKSFNFWRASLAVIVWWSVAIVVFGLPEKGWQIMGVDTNVHGDGVVGIDVDVGHSG